jgi:hypothetical protein
MYRIVKRIVHTITTVTLFVRWENSAKQETVEKQITLPASHSLREEEVVDEINDPKNVHPSSNPTLDEGEK